MKTLNREQVAELIHCHPKSITDKVIKKHPDFPKPIKIGARAFWIETEIHDWILSQPRSK